MRGAEKESSSASMEAKKTFYFFRNEMDTQNNIRAQWDKVLFEVKKLVELQNKSFVEKLEKLQKTEEDYITLKSNFSKTSEELEKYKKMYLNLSLLTEKLKEDKIIEYYEDGDYGYDEYGNGGGYHIQGYKYNGNIFEVYGESL